MNSITGVRLRLQWVSRTSRREPRRRSSDGWGRRYIFLKPQAVGWARSKRVRKLVLPVLALAVIFLLLPFSQASQVTPVTAQTASGYNKMEVWGSQTTDWVIYHEDYETDDDVLTVITGGDGVDANVLSLFDADLRVEALGIDWTESSLGKNTADWTGVVGSTTNTADGGVNYWMVNASTPDETSAGGNGVTWGTVSKTAPASGGYSYMITGTSAESSENSDEDHENRYWVIEEELVDIDITPNSYFYFNVAVKSSGVNETKDSRAYVWMVFSDNVNDIMIFYTFDASATDSTAWADSTPQTNTGGTITEDDTIIWQRDLSTANTYEELVHYFNIEDICQLSAAYSTFSPVRLAEFGVGMAFDYAGETVTVEINQLMIVDNIDDLSLFEDTDASDSSTQRNDNFPNATARTISEADLYSLEDGFVFALDNQIPLNRFSLTSYDVIASPGSSTVTVDRGESQISREDTFDTSFPTDERATEPTWLVNWSVFDADREIEQLTIDGDPVFQADYDVETSDYTLTDKDGSPAINERSDIYDDLTDIDGNVQITPATALGNSNALVITALWNAPSGDMDALEYGSSDWDKPLITIAGLAITPLFLVVVIGIVLLIYFAFYFNLTGSVFGTLGQIGAKVWIIGPVLEGFFGFWERVAKGSIIDEILLAIIGLAIVWLLFL